MMMYICALAALCACLSVSHSLTVSVRPSVSAQLGQTTTLPCWLNPPERAEGLEVRWYRYDRFDNPIILYQSKNLDTSQEASYAGRVSFGLKDAASGGLIAGDVSLRLVNVMTEDAGDYTCYVSSNEVYDRGNVRLRVTETGNIPFLSVAWRDDNSMNVSCKSEGWFPRPRLQWSDQKQVLSPRGLEYSTVSSGLVSVHSWLLASSSIEVSCSVGVSDGEAKEARVRLEKPPKQEAGSSVAGWVAFAILLIALLLTFGALFYKNRGLFLGKKEKSKSSQAEENETLLLQDNTAALEERFPVLKNIYENIELEENKNEYVTIKMRKIRDACVVEHPDGKEVTCLTAVRGKSGFSSGQHYWEVSLARPGVDVKRSWWVGVTNATGFPLSHNVLPTASNGYWFLSSSPDAADSFQFSTEPKVLLPVHSRLQTVGVYLNYDGGELSFYDVQGKCIIGSLKAEFKGEVFPFFNPGKNDKAPMEILHRPAPDECNDTGTNS